MTHFFLLNCSLYLKIALIVRGGEKYMRMWDINLEV